MAAETKDSTFDLEKMGLMVLLFPSGTSEDDELNARDPRIQQLMSHCPKEYKNQNIWLKYINQIMFKTKAERKKLSSGWKWVSEDQEVRINQMNCFQQLFECDILTHLMSSIGCWMLSEMLMEPPVIKLEPFDWPMTGT